MRSSVKRARMGLWSAVVLVVMLFSAITVSADGGKKTFDSGTTTTQSSGNTWEP